MKPEELCMLRQDSTVELKQLLKDESKYLAYEGITTHISKSVVLVNR